VTGVSQGALDAIALSDGELRPRKGVNLLEHPVSLCDLSATDISIVRRIAHRGRLSFAFSFMKDGNEAGWIRRYAPGRAVVGKVERREAASDVRRLARSVDALWICRGDLGAQLGPAAMARWVGSYDPRAETCPVLMAGHVLEHLTAHAAPTRAEVCHLYDLVKRGYAGFVLSDETAVGKDPVAAVGILRGLLISFLDERRNGI